MSSPITALQATANTRQCHNAFFKQQQLKSLHDVLRANSSDIVSAITKDTSVSKAEATTECALALAVIKDHYEKISPMKEIERENQIAQGKDAEDRREPWGVVYLEPDLRHTPFYSTVVALSTAVAAGNCVALKLENNLRALPSLLRSVLPQVLDASNFAIQTSTPSPEALAGCLQVLQETPILLPTHSQLASPRGHVVAIVDRTADLASAAKELVTARFAFGGTSPYAPDLVLVNEFVKKEFTELVLQQSIRFLASGSGTVTDAKKNEKTLDNGDQKNWKSRVITQGSVGCVVELVNGSRKNVALPAKQSSPVFAISSVTSLDHAIDLIASDENVTVSAAYHLADLKTGNYLSRFVDAEVTFINHIPYRLLLGPAAPSSHPFSVSSRYTVEHFTRPTPAFVSTSTDAKIFATSSQSEKEALKLLREAAKEIKEKKRKEWMSHGFFEQGIMVGLGLYGIPLLTCIGAGLFYGIRTGVRYFPSF